MTSASVAGQHSDLTGTAMRTTGLKSILSSVSINVFTVYSGIKRMLYIFWTLYQTVSIFVSIKRTGCLYPNTVKRPTTPNQNRSWEQYWCCYLNINCNVQQNSLLQSVQLYFQGHMSTNMKQ